MDLEGLKDKPEIVETLKNLHGCVDNIERVLEIVYSDLKRRDVGVKNKIDLDLFIAYTLNTLYWMYLRTAGVDPNTSDIKTQLVRVRDNMIKAKNAVSNVTNKPTINQNVAKRFIQHGIGRSNKERNQDERPDDTPKKKKRTN